MYVIIIKDKKILGYMQLHFLNDNLLFFAFCMNYYKMG